MDDGVKTFQILSIQVAKVFANGLGQEAVRHESDLAEIAGIQPRDFVAGFEQKGSHDRADVTVVASDQDVFRIVHSWIFFCLFINSRTASSRFFCSETNNERHPAASAA